MSGSGQGAPEVSASAPDWSRERPRRWWDPGRRLLRTIRRYQAARARGGVMGAVQRRYWALMHRVWSTVAQAEIDLSAEIGGGLKIPHPNGIVIHPDAVIGPNCLLFQQVTLGTVGTRPGVPRLGGHVDVGAGAKILGPLTVGDHARIGANAVVTRDVAPGAVVAGIPAREIGGAGAGASD